MGHTVYESDFVYLELLIYMLGESKRGQCLSKVRYSMRRFTMLSSVCMATLSCILVYRETSSWNPEQHGIAPSCASYSSSALAFAGMPNSTLSSVRFVHIPKTGTSFIITLRNHLVACKTKDYSCKGILGGGFYEINNPNGTGDSPFFASVEDDDEHCKGVLQACQVKMYHRPFSSLEVELRRNRPLPLLTLPQYLTAAGVPSCAPCRMARHT